MNHMNVVAKTQVRGGGGRGWGGGGSSSHCITCGTKNQLRNTKLCVKAKKVGPLILK